MCNRLERSPRSVGVHGSMPGSGIPVWGLHVALVPAWFFFRVLTLPPTFQKHGRHAINTTDWKKKNIMECFLPNPDA